MSSIRQEILAKNIVKNKMLPPSKRKNKTTLVESSGYTKIQALKKQKEIMESKGVQKEIKLILKQAGLTEELIAESLVYDIENKPKKRVHELSLASEILGMKQHKEQAPQMLQNIAVFIKQQEKPTHIENKDVTQE